MCSPSSLTQNFLWKALWLVVAVTAAVLLIASNCISEICAADELTALDALTSENAFSSEAFGELELLSGEKVGSTADFDPVANIDSLRHWYDTNAFDTPGLENLKESVKSFLDAAHNADVAAIVNPSLMLAGGSLGFVSMLKHAEKWDKFYEAQKEREKKAHEGGNPSLAIDPQRKLSRIHRPQLMLAFVTFASFVMFAGGLSCGIINILSEYTLLIRVGMLSMGGLAGVLTLVPCASLLHIFWVGHRHKVKLTRGVGETDDGYTLQSPPSPHNVSNEAATQEADGEPAPVPANATELFIVSSENSALIKQDGKEGASLLTLEPATLSTERRKSVTGHRRRRRLLQERHHRRSVMDRLARSELAGYAL